MPPVTPDRISLPDRYRVVRHLANGGMASVWEAHDELLDRDVAVKLLASHLGEDERARRRFQREARAAAGLSSHPNVVTIYDVGEHRNRVFMVMEIMRGGTLGDRLKSGRSISHESALQWLSQAAAALDTAHDAGVVHRDIKPGNLLLDEHDRLAVADFGIARLAWEDQLTATGQVLGTAAYLSPEQALGEAATAASDRYALAVVAYELLTGVRPFDADHFAAQARAHVEDPVPPASSRTDGLTRAVDAVLERALAKKPGDRWPSSSEFVSQLERTLGQAAGDETAVTRRFGWRGRRKGAAADPGRGDAGDGGAAGRGPSPARDDDRGGAPAGQGWASAAAGAGAADAAGRRAAARRDDGGAGAGGSAARRDDGGAGAGGSAARRDDGGAGAGGSAARHDDGWGGASAGGPAGRGAAADRGDDLGGSAELAGRGATTRREDDWGGSANRGGGGASGRGAPRAGAGGNGAGRTAARRGAAPAPRRGSAAPLLIGLGALVLLAVVGAIALASRGNNDNGGNEAPPVASPRVQHTPKATATREKTPEATPTESATEAPTDTATPEPADTPSPEPTDTPKAPSGKTDLPAARKAQLAGYNARRSGDYQTALTKAQEAEQACGDTHVLDPCGYALFEQGVALSALGQPDAAIPILERRLNEYGDNSSKEVSKALKEARRKAREGN